MLQHVALETRPSDVDAVLEFWSPRCATPATASTHAPSIGGFPRAFVTDPSGHVVEVMSSPPPG